MASDSKHFETLAWHGGPYRADPVRGDARQLPRAAK